MRKVVSIMLLFFRCLENNFCIYGEGKQVAVTSDNSLSIHNKISL